MDKRILSVFLLFTSVLVAQDTGSMDVTSPATSKFGNMAGLPACMPLSVVRGDPSKGPSVILIKFAAGCTIPWHWHTANEQLVIVSGTGVAQMKDGKPLPMKVGDYIFLPGKGIHRFTAKSQVVLYDIPEGAFDVHYVDAAGNEIPPDKALAAQIKVKPSAAPVTTH